MLTCNLPRLVFGLPDEETKVQVSEGQTLTHQEDGQ